MTTGEISAHFAEVYGASVSKETISGITERVVEEMRGWQTCPLDEVYAAIFVDAIVETKACLVWRGRTGPRPFAARMRGPAMRVASVLRVVAPRRHGRCGWGSPIGSAAMHRCGWSPRWPVVTVTATGLAVRLVWLLFAGHTLALGDALVYHEQANVLAAGRGFINPLQWQFFHRAMATAEHPPLYPLALSVVSLFGGRSVLAHQIASCVLGAGTVAVVAFAGRRIAGPRVGLLAGTLTAVYPNLWLNDTQVMSETLYALTLALFVIAVYRFHDCPSIGAAALVGGAVGVAALTRAEALALVMIVIIPVVLLTSGLSPGRRAASAAVAVATAVLVVAPWVVRNLVTFDRPILFSINADTALVGANCPAAYYGAGTGSWIFTCEADVEISGDESNQAAMLRRHALDYIGSHIGRVPVVLLARQGRTWSVFRPLQDDSEPRGATAWVRVVSFLALTPFSFTGVWLLRRRGCLTLPLVGMAVLSAVTAVTTYGAMRFRLPWEVALVILAAVAIDAVLPAPRPAVAQRRPDHSGYGTQQRER